jgi:type IV pilus assembly protein PilA
MTAQPKRGFTLIELLVVIGVLAILLSIVLIAINPARQFAQANDTRRRSEVTAILNGIHQFAAENKGKLPTGMPAKGAAAIEISDAAADICRDLMPRYLPSFPNDNTGESPLTACPDAGGYTTGYFVSVDADGRVTVSRGATGAPETEGGDAITITR